MSFISSVMEEGLSLVESKAVFNIYDITVRGPKIGFSASGLKVKSSSLAKHLRGSVKAALFVCTIGKDLPEKINSYVSGGEIARATVLDAVGSEAAEALADAIDKAVTKNAGSEGFSTIARFSPGYGDWSIFDQAKILKVLKAEKIGVRATKSCIMLPEKSVTACIGLLKAGHKPIRKVYERGISKAKK